jgi:hypothetical protein
MGWDWMGYICLIKEEEQVRLTTLYNVQLFFDFSSRRFIYLPPLPPVTPQHTELLVLSHLESELVKLNTFLLHLHYLRSKVRTSSSRLMVILTRLLHPKILSFIFVVSSVLLVVLVVSLNLLEVQSNLCLWRHE